VAGTNTPAASPNSSDSANTEAGFQAGAWPHQIAQTLRQLRAANRGENLRRTRAASKSARMRASSAADAVSAGSVATMQLAKARHSRLRTVTSARSFEFFFAMPRFS